MQNYTIDIQALHGPLVLYVAQGDAQSRIFQITVTDGGAAYTFPEGAAFSVRYGAQGMPSGWYDQITEADGSTRPAVSAAANVLTVEVASQATGKAGTNALNVVVNTAEGYQLASWPFLLIVTPVPGSSDADASVYDDLLSQQVAQTLANAQAAAASASESAASATLSESWAVGGTGTREGEDTDNAEYYAGQAQSGAQVVQDNQAAIQAIQDNLAAVQNAATNTQTAQTAATQATSSASQAAASAEEAQEWAERAQQVAQGALGWYETEQALQAAHPTGTNGQWAIIGSTDTIWTWDSDTSAWVDSGSQMDLSQYYTKTEANATFATAAQVQAATSRTFTAVLPASGWTGSGDAGYTQTVSCTGMTADVVTLPPAIQPTGVRATDIAAREALGYISMVETQEGQVTVTCWESRPEVDLTLYLVEAR